MRPTIPSRQGPAAVRRDPGIDGELRSFLFPCVLALPLASCIPIFPGDGIVQATGQIVGARTKEACTVALTNAADPARTLQTRTVSGEFMLNFMVPPTRDVYVVDLVCDGVRVDSQRVDRSHQRSADFGRVVL